MTTTTQLSPSQYALLAHAAQHTGSIIEWFPDNLKGGARNKVLEALEKRGLLENTDSVWHLTDAAFELFESPKDVGSNDTHEGLQNLEGTQNVRIPFSIRPGTKQATLIAMLQRPDGATVHQVMQSTGWLAHTVRGAISGAIKKKLGLNVVSQKSPSGERAYRIV